MDVTATKIHWDYMTFDSTSISSVALVVCHLKLIANTLVAFVKKVSLLEEAKQVIAA